MWTPDQARPILRAVADGELPHAAAVPGMPRNIAALPLLAGWANRRLKKIRCQARLERKSALSLEVPEWNYHLSTTPCSHSAFLDRVDASRYSVVMDEKDFQKRCDTAFEELRGRLQQAGDVHGFEVEGGSGKLEVLFEEPEETKFVISPNTPVRQIWISALSTSFKLAWSDTAGAFVLEKTGETLMQLMGRLLTEQLGSPVSV